MIVVKVVAGAAVVATAGIFAAYTCFKDEFRHPPERDVNLVRRLGPWRYVSNTLMSTDISPNIVAAHFIWNYRTI